MVRVAVAAVGELSLVLWYIIVSSPRLQLSILFKLLRFVVGSLYCLSLLTNQAFLFSIINANCAGIMFFLLCTVYSAGL